MQRYNAKVLWRRIVFNMMLISVLVSLPFNPDCITLSQPCPYTPRNGIDVALKELLTYKNLKFETMCSKSYKTVSQPGQMTLD